MFPDAIPVSVAECKKVCKSLDVQSDKIPVASLAAIVTHMFPNITMCGSDVMSLWEGFTREHNAQQQFRKRRGAHGFGQQQQQQPQQLVETHHEQGAMVSRQSQTTAK